MSTEDFRLALNEPIGIELTDGHDQATRDFIALCRRHDEDTREQQRIRDIDTAITSDETCYSLAKAALERGDSDAALGLLWPAAEAGVRRGAVAARQPPGGNRRRPRGNQLVPACRRRRQLPRSPQTP